MEHSYSFSKEKEVEGHVSCPICKRLCSIQRLKMHIENQHNKVKEFKCSHCDLQALSSLTILYHIRSYHPGKEETIFKLPTDTSIEKQNLPKSSVENKCREVESSIVESQVLVEVRETFNDTDTTIDQNSIIHQDVPQSPEQSSVITSASETMVLVENLVSNPAVAAETEVYTTVKDNTESYTANSDNAEVNTTLSDSTEDNNIASDSVDDIRQDEAFYQDSHTIDETVEDQIIILEEVGKKRHSEKDTIGKAERKSKFSKKLSSEELNKLLKIKSKCGLCGILISDRFVERHLENKHNILISRQNHSQQQVCETQAKKSTTGVYSSLSAADIQHPQQQQQQTKKQQHLIERQQPQEIKKKLCMLKVAKGYKMCGKCGQVYLKLKIHRRSCTG